jgi:putative transposase
MSESNSSSIIRTYKFRLFPNANQERELVATLETHRRLWNQVLDGKMLCWEMHKVDWAFSEQSRWFTIQRSENPHYSRINFSSAEQTLRNLEKAFQAFYRRVKAGQSPGYPRFRSRDTFQSFTFKMPKWSDGCRVIDGKLRLQHIGTIRVRWHRELPADGKIKTVTIKREAGKWFACFAVETPKPDAVAPAARVGIDVGLKSFVTTSDGESLGDSRSLERALPELRRRQRALARCKRGSNLRKKVKQRVVALHAKVREVRRDMHHKVSRSLVNRYGVIAAESLHVQSLMGNSRLARRIGDAGWHSFITILTSKAASAGARVIQVDARGTSQECSDCGATVPKALKVRVHKCPCGCELDRDVNAARNILARGLAWTGPEGRNTELFVCH